MSKKLLLPISLTLLFGVSVFVVLKKYQIVTNPPSSIPIVTIPGSTQNGEKQPRFVIDVDPDVSHWQTKETEFFKIKFPKEWYWIESDLKEPTSGY